MSNDTRTPREMAIEVVAKVSGKSVDYISRFDRKEGFTIVHMVDLAERSLVLEGLLSRALDKLTSATYDECGYNDREYYALLAEIKDAIGEETR